MQCCGLKLLTPVHQNAGAQAQHLRQAPSHFILLSLLPTAPLSDQFEGLYNQLYDLPEIFIIL